MSNKYKIKTVKDWKREGPPQFDIILRRSTGKVMNYQISSGSGEFKFERSEVLCPPDAETGIIRIVKRISDDIIFHQSDMVDTNNIGSCFIIEFNEDLIHCVVADIFEKEVEYKKVVEINELTARTDLMSEEKAGDLGGELYDLEA